MENVNKKNIMIQICDNEIQQGITQFVIEHYNYVGLNALNLRTQQKAFKIHEWSEKEGKEWEKELLLFLKSEMSETRRLLYSLIGNRAIKTTELKKILIRSQYDGISHLRTADRRLHDWLVLGELHIVGFGGDEEAIENYVATHRNFAVCINDTSDRVVV